MIQLYIQDNTEFTQNGDVVLIPSTALVHVVLNSTWEANLTHPIDEEGRWKYIQEEAVVKMPSFNGDQLFRIKQKTKTDSSIEAVLEPIFMDAKDDCFLVDVRPTLKNGQEALNIMTAPNARYSAQSDITSASTSYYIRKNLIEAINGDEENSFINRWGGEILFDNFTVIINNRVGSDYGVEIRYGKNIPQDGITEEIDDRSIVTRIYPQGYNGRTMTNDGYVDSKLIESYPVIKAAAMTFENVKLRADMEESEEEDGIIICETQEELDAVLTECCEAQFEAGLDKPTVSISVDTVLLQDSPEYAEYQPLENVSLGDTVHCRHSRLDIDTKARVVELTYDALRRRVSEVVLGDFQYNYFNDISSAASRIEGAIRADGSVMAERVAGIINGVNASLSIQSTAAQKVSGRAFLIEDLDPSSELFGAMEAGTQGFRIANNRTADGRAWEWRTAITAEGIVADAVITGLLSDKLARNYWNLDTGEFRLASDTTVGGKSISEIANDAVDAQTQADIFNKLTNNGAVQGIYMQNAKLYINATYMATGIISDKTGKNYWNLDTGELHAGNATFAGKLQAATGSFKGEVTATSGSIGPNTITKNGIETHGGSFIVGNDSYIAMRDYQGALHGIIRPYDFNNNPNLTINAMGNVLYLGAFDTPGGIQCMEGLFNADGVPYSTSDKRQKEDIRGIPPADSLAFINRLSPVSFRYKGKKKVHRGFVAQEVLKAIKDSWDIVTEYDHVVNRETMETQKRYALAYDELLADIAGAIQEVDRKVNNLYEKTGMYSN